jgi:hypothetical protein
MSYYVYEVEIEPVVLGQRLCQHIKAASASEACAKVAEIQGRKILCALIWRACSQDEIDAIGASK